MKQLKNYDLYEQSKITNLQQLIIEKSNQVPELPTFQYLVEGQIKTITYKQFYQDVDNLNIFLHYQGLENLKIALLGENSYDWILSYFAVVLSSNIIVPIDKELSSNEIGNLLINSDTTVLIYSDSYTDIAEEMLSHNHVQKLFNMKDFPIYLNEEEQVPYEKKYISSKNKIDENKVCSIIYTSGTTGIPKGVMLSQKNLMTDAVNSCMNVYFSGPSLLTLPLHHTFAFTAGVLMMFIYNVPICISKSLRTFKTDMRIFRPHHMFLVPLYVETLYKTIWENARKQKKERFLKTMIAFSNFTRKFGLDFRKILFHSILEQFGGKLELIISGGAPIAWMFADGMEDIGIQVLNGYGITECSPVIAVNRNQYYRKNSVGLPLPCCKIKIQNDEIWVKGPNIMLGYYKNDASTKEALEDGWFKTGDLGYQDQDDFLYITGRKKNLIILSNGENISPEELEEKVQSIEYVREVLVYAKDGNITAEIFTENETHVQQEIIKLNKELPSYKRIQKVIFRNSEFEKTTTRKIKR